MPQITIEYSDNVKCSDLKSTASGLHQILCQMLPTEVRNCKTRIIMHEDYLIGDGNESGAFVHVDIAVNGGRTMEVINSTAKVVLEHMRNAIGDQGPGLQITVEIRELSAAYFKYSN